MITIIKGLLKAFWSSFLEAALSLIAGKSKEAIKNIVAALQDSNLTGEQKKAEAIKQIKALGIDLKGSLLNLAIEISLNLVKGWKP